jgi:uncharacterized damage-inducible protein DinB
VTVAETKTQRETLLDYLQTVRETVLWKLDGVSEYDARRPLTPTGSNLLGLVKHLAYVEFGYFVESFGRPMPIPELAAVGPDTDPHDDLCARVDESRDDVIGYYRLAWEESARTFADHELDSVVVVPWWQPSRNRVTLALLLVHMIAETNRHAGHMDILRETIDGATGLRADNSNHPDDGYDWAAYLERVEAAARTFR